ncbi:2-hydroxyacyl-CoA dehydratase family protein [Tissierella sp. MSJ-40]|uniref:2-hydroxyacyl-CoA dehydratase family protein n=1 Tax=Tissierella simiarum TaxID=2841534 RepID=A0ABS6E0W4_9FIRM|nr:double-cubane-cluster-containing anaerobic reductase [Tissierella simiarum]MBU5436546.1 2-hydroxyacyl-CoA dehydratase family protein [Tissierella simiarum]
MDNFEMIKNGTLKAKEIKENGGKIAGIFCSFAPVEILDAAGIHIVNLCGTSNESIINSESDLPKNLCPLIKSSYGTAISDKCGYTYLSDIIIGETTCDGKKKMYELLSELKDIHIMQLPQGIDRSYSSLMWEKEVRLLIKILEEKFGIEITEKKLKEATSFRNNFRSLYGELFELSKLEPPAITGFDMYKILEEYKFNFDLKEEYKQLEELINQIKKDYEEGARPVDNKAKRILVTGCPLGGVLDKIVNTIENSGGVVVCFENCEGIKSIRNKVDENTDDIIKAIADRYLNIGCSVMTPNLKRIELLPELIEEFKVDAVIEVVLQTCHSYSVESRTIKKLITDTGIPYMALETDYSESNIGQIKTRIAAFVEIL